MVSLWDNFIITYIFVLEYCHVRIVVFFFFQAEDGIRDLVRSRGLGDVYKRQPSISPILEVVSSSIFPIFILEIILDATKIADKPLSLIHI